MIPEAKIYLAEVSFSEADDILSYTSQPSSLRDMPSDRIDRFNKFYKSEDKIRCYRSWKLLGTALMEVFSIDLAEERISYNDWGKPLLADRPDIHFNLSHSGKIICCIVDEHPVGIDVEVVSSIDLSIAGNYFSKEESADLFSRPSQEQTDYFFKLWTLKEGYIKASGKGLSIPLDSFTFKIEGGSVFLKDDDKLEFILRDIHHDGLKYYLASCTARGRNPGELR